MRLKRFDNKLPSKKKNYKQIAIVLCICLIAVLSFTSHALFKVYDYRNIVNSKVGKFRISDVTLAIVIDGKKSDTFPAKNSGKVFDSLTCTNGGVASWNSFDWELSINKINKQTDCTIKFKTGVEPEAPVLNNGLIPVRWNGGAWVKADTTKKWYDYYTQEWANAVTVSEGTRDTYTNAEANTPIKMDDIETMWVWIPRYEYQHTNLSTQYAGGSSKQPGGITINFISKDTITSSSANFTIHDAFWWDNDNNGVKRVDEQLSGIWVAKFEMSAQNPTRNTLQSPIIKPNVPSWRNAQIGTFWTAIHNNMNGENNAYGLTNSDAHLMKNIEWGAVAYLSQSKYGKYGNSNYEGTNKEVAINNCSNYVTGIGGDTVSAAESSTTCTTNTYETEKGQGASTTGNIYGIYDMSGGSWEYVMGIQATEANPLEPMVGMSGWSGKTYDEGNWTEYEGTYGPLKEIGSKYYDIYTFGTSSTTTEVRAHKGDATFETKGWYSDFALFVYAGYPFFSRGASNTLGFGAGVFYMDYTILGGLHMGHSGRPVLVQAS